MESPAVISRSTAFLLAEIRRIFNEREERSDRIFAAHEERWDRRFSSPRSTAASAAPASGLEPASTPSATVPATSVPLTGASTPASSTAVPSVATTPAPTSELASHTNISKRGINSSSHAQVVDGDRKEMEVDEFLDSGLSASRPRRAPLRQHRPRRPRRAPRCVRRLRRPLRAPLRPPRPRRPRQAPLRPVQPLRRRPPRPPCSPTKCSTICLSRPIDLLQSVNTRATRWTLPPTSLHFTAERCCLFGRRCLR